MWELARIEDADRKRWRRWRRGLGEPSRVIHAPLQNLAGKHDPLAKPFFHPPPWASLNPSQRDLARLIVQRIIAQRPALGLPPIVPIPFTKVAGVVAPGDDMICLKQGCPIVSWRIDLANFSNDEIERAFISQLDQLRLKLGQTEQTRRGERDAPYAARLRNLALTRLWFHMSPLDALRLLNTRPKMRFWSPNDSKSALTAKVTRNIQAAGSYFSEAFPILKDFSTRDYWLSYPNRTRVRRHMTSNLPDLPKT